MRETHCTERDRPADTKWTDFYFVFLKISNTHKRRKSDAVNLHIPVAHIQQVNLDIATHVLSIPFFFFIFFTEVF